MGKIPVVTAGVSEGFSEGEIGAMFNQGLEMLKERSDEDSEYFKLRVVRKDEPRVWIIEDGEAITLLLPEEY